MPPGALHPLLPPHLQYPTEVTLFNCTFERNWAAAWGGAVNAASLLTFNVTSW